MYYENRTKNKWIVVGMANKEAQQLKICDNKPDAVASQKAIEYAGHRFDKIMVAGPGETVYHERH